MSVNQFELIKYISRIVSTNLLISRHVPTYDRFAINRNYINSINSSHVKCVVLMEKVKD